MTHKCNGCGGEIEHLGGTFSWGGPSQLPDIHERASVGRSGLWTADYTKTLCPKCTRVMKEILLNSDLSEHWGDDDG
jgi:hypothetical protein